MDFFYLQKRFSLLVFLILSSFLSLKAQTKAKDEVRDDDVFEELDFKLFSAFGHCDIMPTQTDLISVIYGDYDEDRIGYKINKQSIRQTQKVELDIKGKKPSVFSFLNSSTKAHSDWNIYLSKKKDLNLDLTFGHGDANISLSGLHLKKLLLTNSNADVSLDYRIGQANPRNMDSIILDVKTGHVHFKHLEMAKANTVDVFVDFGKVELDFDHKVIKRTEVNVEVGGGKFIVHLPKEDIPVLVKFKHKEFRAISIPEGYVRTKEGYYRSSSYKEGIKSPIIFNLDLSIGSTVSMLVL